jgi:integrase
LKWEQIDFASGTIQIVKSKSLAGRRSIPMSSRCRKALLEWRARTSPQFSPFVFANPARPNTHLIDIRVSWSATLKSAGLEYFWKEGVTASIPTTFTKGILKQGS